jgi:hypothetical protein
MMAQPNPSFEYLCQLLLGKVPNFQYWADGTLSIRTLKLIKIHHDQQLNWPVSDKRVINEKFMRFEFEIAELIVCDFVKSTLAAITPTL